MRVCQFRHFGSGKASILRTAGMKSRGPRRFRGLSAMADETDAKVISTNRKAFHDYSILERYEAGLVLRGTEVKSLREAQVNFKDSYATIDNDEAWLVGCYVSPYHHGTDANHDPERRRKLLLHKREIARLLGKIAERGLTLSHSSILQGRAREGRTGPGPRQEAPRQARVAPRARKPAGDGKGITRPIPGVKGGDWFRRGSVTHRWHHECSLLVKLGARL